MFLYLVKRTDDVDWDENRSGVLAAESLERVELLSLVKFGKYSTFDIKLIGTAVEGTEEGSILIDFKAG